MVYCQCQYGCSDSNARYRFAKINLGKPPQEVEMDLDMLLSDFYVVTTTSSTGSRYDDFFSQSYGTDPRVFFILA